MKKIGIITIHNVYNYGAVLQSFALQKKIETLGVEAELVDYDAPQMKKSRKLFSKCNSLKNVFKNINTLFSYNKLKERSFKFQKFMSENMRLSGRTYHSREDFKNFPLDYDCTITGSDQTFCLHLRPNVNEMKPYFLECINGKKASYASSFGEKVKLNTPEEEGWISEQLLRYDYLSVREGLSADYVNKLTGRTVDIVLDPTLLFAKEDWEKYEKPTKYDNEKYVLFYSVLSDKWVVKHVKEFSKKTNLKVIAVHKKNVFEFSCGFKRCINIGPGEFLTLIKNAQFVVTSSFHATVFSLIYSKKFLSFVLGEGNRLTSLLKLVGLETHLIKKGENKLKEQFQEQIDFDLVQKKLCEEREKSTEFLKKVIL